MDENLESTERLVDIVKKVGGNVYLSGPSGQDYMDESSFEEESIKLEYQNYQCKEYKQVFPDFHPNLSVLDLLFNEGPHSKNFI